MDSAPIRVVSSLFSWGWRAARVRMPFRQEASFISTWVMTWSSMVPGDSSPSCYFILWGLHPEPQGVDGLVLLLRAVLRIASVTLGEIPNFLLFLPISPRCCSTSTSDLCTPHRCARWLPDPMSAAEAHATRGRADTLSPSPDLSNHDFYNPSRYPSLSRDAVNHP